MYEKRRGEWQFLTHESGGGGESETASLCYGVRSGTHLDLVLLVGPDCLMLNEQIGGSSVPGSLGALH